MILIRKTEEKDNKSFKDILIYYTGYETLDGVEPLYVDFNKINEYIEDDNGRKYLRLIPVDKNKDKIKNYKKA